MNRLKQNPSHRLSTPWLLLCLALTMPAFLAACRTSPTAINLSGQLERESKFLTKKHEETIDSYSAFVRSVEERVTPIVTNSATLYSLLAKARLAQLTSQCSVLELGLKAEFQSQALALQKEFKEQIDKKFDPPINDKVAKLEKLSRESKIIAYQNPGDMVALRVAFTNRTQFGELLIKRLEHALRLEEEFQKAIDQQRTKTFAEIEAAARNWREQIAGEADGPIAEATKALRHPTTLPTVSLSSKQDELSTFKAAILSVHQAHSDSLRQMDEYINRPSGLRLFLSGAFDEAKGKVTNLTAKLGPIGKFLNVDQMTSLGSEALNRQVSRLETKISSFSEKMPEIIDNMIRKSVPQIVPVTATPAENPN